MRKQTPLIYFHGIVTGKYLAVWPVFILGDDPGRLSFTVAVDDSTSIYENVNKSTEYMVKVAEEDKYFKRKYITFTIRQRLHQKSFRERVLKAYREQCAFCRLKYTRLLDAAHIIPDTDELGEPTISNGLSLCKIHHAAFDSNFIGVSPDFKIIVREDIRRERDGLMLKYGIQQLHDKRIILPRNKELWPDQDRLNIRFKKFIGA
jgi:putative restriction endonuclease